MGFGLRPGRRLVVAALVFVVTLAGCARGPLHDVLHPHFSSGSDAADRIEADIGALIAANHPGIIVGHARCPFLVDISGSVPGRCLLPVSGGELRIDVERAAFPTVTFGRPPRVPHNVWVIARDSPIVRRDAERDVADDLDAKYGIEFTVHCPGPAVRIVPQPSTIRCALSSAGKSRGFARVDVDDNLLSATGPPQLPTLERLFAHHSTRSHGSAVVDGTTTARYVQAIAGDQMHATLARHGLIHAAHCPARIVVGEHATSACTIEIGTHVVRYGIRYEHGAGLSVGTNSALEYLPDIQRLSERYYTRVLPLIAPDASRRRVRVHSDCGRGAVAVIVIDDEGASMTCTLHIGNETLPFSVDLVGDGDGRDVRFYDDRH